MFNCTFLGCLSFLSCYEIKLVSLYSFKLCDDIKHVRLIELNDLTLFYLWPEEKCQ